MTDKATLVMTGFLQLTDTDKLEVAEEITKYYKASFLERQVKGKSFHEKRAAVVLGPTSGSCPCCGR